MTFDFTTPPELPDPTVLDAIEAVLQLPEDDEARFALVSRSPFGVVWLCLCGRETRGSDRYPPQRCECGRW